MTETSALRLFPPSWPAKAPIHNFAACGRESRGCPEFTNEVEHSEDLGRRLCLGSLSPGAPRLVSGEMGIGDAQQRM